MVTDGGYTCGECSIMYRVVESLCCTLETNITLCFKYIQIIIKKKQNKTWPASLSDGK